MANISEGDNFSEGLITVNLNSDTWMNEMKKAVEFGKVVLIESIQQDIHPLLDPLLSRAFTKQGNQLYV